MCIIAAKPAGVPMPNETTLANMWYGNPDGAGFMYTDKGTVHIEKGFMTYTEFCEALDRLRDKHDLTKLPIVMHFRITTHGGTKPENCHPFPISDSVGILSKLTSKTKVGVAHNGIIDITPRKGISDTMEYIISQLAPLSRAVPEFYKDKNLMQMVSNAISSRMAFLTKDGEIYTIGDFVEDEGIMYSNKSYTHSSFRDFSYGCSTGGGWAYSDDDYGYDFDYSTGWTKGSYFMKTVMWLDQNDCFVNGFPVYTDDAFAIDSDGRVYLYDVDMDALIRVADASVISNTGTTVRFDPDSPYTMSELVFEPGYSPDPAGKKSKKKKGGK